MWVKAYLLSYKQLMFALDEARYGKTLSIFHEYTQTLTNYDPSVR